MYLKEIAGLAMEEIGKDLLFEISNLVFTLWLE